MALRIAAGADPLDVATNHCVNDDQPMVSFWMVIDAIHKSSQMDIQFPTLHEEQEKVAKEFRSKSNIGISCCAGAIDSILIWIHKPSDADCATLGFGQTKFFCGRKKKFGLNVQAVCGAWRCFLWVVIRYPGRRVTSLLLIEALSRINWSNQAFFTVDYACLVMQPTPTHHACAPQSTAHHHRMCVWNACPSNWNFAQGVSSECDSGEDKLSNFGFVQTQKLMHPVVEQGWRYEEEDRLDNLLDGGQHMDDHDKDDDRWFITKTGDS
eukprot:scaffold3895_cov97-Alexandrium_tamarense.AAC.3